MAITRTFLEFRKTWLSIGDKANDVLVGDGVVDEGPSKGEWHTKDEMRGGSGDDHFDGEFGNNIMFGERGADTFEIANAGTGGSWDRAYGGAGRDTFLAFEYTPMDGRVHLANGGGRFDTMEFQYAVTTGEDGPVVVRNEKVFLNGTVTIRLKSIEKLVASVDDDSIRASGAIVHAEGGKGDDTLVANPDKGTTLIGGFGSDTLKGRGKNDTLFDQEEITSERPEYIDPGRDTLNGGNGQDLLLSYSGNDTLLGGDGDDTLVSLGGTDVLKGGNGSDRFEFSYLGISGDVIATLIKRSFGTLEGLHIDGGADGLHGDHVIFSGLQVGYGASTELGLVINLARGTGEEHTSLDGPGRFRIKDVEDLTGSSLADRLTGSSEGNTLRGGYGNDILKGGAGRDILIGGKGRDQLFGGNGDDILRASDDGDILTGGYGRDSFKFFDVDTGTMTVTDFEIANDWIMLDAPGFKSLSFADSTAGAVVTMTGSDLKIVLEGISAADLTSPDFVFL